MTVSAFPGSHLIVRDRRALEEVAQVKGVYWEVQRGGEVIPVVKITPVRFGTTTVTEALYGDPEDFNRLALRLDDEVYLHRQRRGVVVITGKGFMSRQGTVFGTPAKCPSCGGRLYVSNGRRYCERSYACKEQLAHAIKYFALPDAMDIPMLTGKLADRLVETGMVKTLADLYSLRPEVVFFLDCMTMEKADDLINQIDASRTASYDRLIYGLGIPGIKRPAAWELSRSFESMGPLMKATEDELKKIQSVGPTLSKTIPLWASNKLNQKAAMELQRVLSATMQKPPYRKTRQNKHPLRNKRFMVSGNFRNYGRLEIKVFLEALGGREVRVVSPVTTMLIVGSDFDVMLFREAKKLGVEIKDDVYLDQLFREYAYMNDKR